MLRGRRLTRNTQAGALRRHGRRPVRHPVPVGDEPRSSSWPASRPPPRPRRAVNTLARNWPAKALFTGWALTMFWFIFAAWLRHGGCGSPDQPMSWLELANGATWPAAWHDLCRSSPATFAMVLSARTALNFAGPLVVIVTGIWFVTGGLERLMQMTQAELMRQLSSELVASLHALVRKNHPDTRADSLARELREMQALADEVVNDFVVDVETRERRAERGLAR